MDTIQLPTIALPTSFGGAAPALQPGQIVQALVLALLENGAYRLQLPNAVLDVRSEIPLVPGSTVRVAVKGTPTNLKLVVLPEGAASQAPSARPAPNVPQGASTPAGHGSRPALAEAVIVEKGQALPRPDGLPTIEAPKITPATPDRSPRPIAPEQALSAAVARAASRHGGLGPLLANIAHLLQDRAAPLPEPVRAAGAHVLALRLPLASLTAQDLKAAFARSGLALEGKLATASSQAPAAPSGTPAPDLKAALLVLRHVLKVWAASEPAQVPRPAVSAPAHAAETPSDLPRPPAMSLLNGLPDFPDPEVAAPVSLARAVRVALEQSARAPSEPSVNPPPPYRGAPTAAQPVARASIDNVTPRETAERLLAQTDAALARHTLLQASSLPDRAEPGARTEAGPRWNFEIPLATPQGTGIAHFEVSRDGHAAPAETVPAVWRACFSLDIEPNGPVHALVTLASGRAGVTLWAERPATAAKLHEGAVLLSHALRGAELEPSELQVRLGAPRAARPAAPGRFMDRAT